MYLHRLKKVGILFICNGISSFSEDKAPSFNGLTLGYNYAVNLIKNVPVYVELGGAVQYSFFSEERTAEIYNNQKIGDDKYSLLSLKIPVSISYKHQIPNSAIAISPYAGLVLRGNIVGKCKKKYNDDYKAFADYLAGGYFTLEDYNLDLFSEDDMGKDDVWSRIQIGWQAGVNVYVTSFLYLGASYGTDFSHIATNLKVNTGSITIGYKF